MRALVMIALVACGCVAPPSGPPRVALVDFPPPSQLLPDEATMPPGFHRSGGQVEHGTWKGFVDGATAVFDRANGTGRISVGVLRFDTDDDAHAAFAEMGAGQNATRIQGADEAIGDTHGSGNPDESFVFARRGLVLLAVAAEARAGSDAADVEALAAACLAKVPRA